MLSLSFQPDGRPLRVLALGAHPDDIEIGAGGTILRLVEGTPEIDVCWVVLAAADERICEAKESAAAFLHGVRTRQVIIREFPDGFLPYHGESVKRFLEELKGVVWPDLILTHYRSDLHQDHRLVSELTWNTFRDHLILEYEVPKYDGDLGSPNVFVPLSEGLCRRKIELLLRHFSSQRSRPWFREDVFLSLLRLRGMEAASQSNYSEAFYGRKVLL